MDEESVDPDALAAAVADRDRKRSEELAALERRSEQRRRAALERIAKGGRRAVRFSEGETHGLAVRGRRGDMFDWIMTRAVFPFVAAIGLLFVGVAAGSVWTPLAIAGIACGFVALSLLRFARRTYRLVVARGNFIIYQDNPSNPLAFGRTAELELWTRRYTGHTGLMELAVRVDPHVNRQTVLVVRPLTPEDVEAIEAFRQEHEIQA